MDIRPQVTNLSAPVYTKSSSVKRNIILTSVEAILRSLSDNIGSKDY